MKGLKIRRARAADAAMIARHRAGMLRDMGVLRPKDEAWLERKSRLHFRREIPRGTYLGWIAEVRGEVVGGVGVLPRPMLPSPAFRNVLLEPHVLNMYVELAWRRQGVARALMAAVLAWSRRKGAPRISLHASDMGRPLYRKMGFKPTNEMRLLL